MSNQGRLGGFLSLLLGRGASCPRGTAKLLLLVEGRHDVSFLTGISSILHRDDRRSPDLRLLEQTGKLVFVPIGGGDVIAWASRLAPIGLPEMFVLDRELPPATDTRQPSRQEIPAGAFSMCKYTVMTYDSDLGEFTPQPGVSSGPYTKWQLRRALRCLRELGYEARRGDPSVRVERVDRGPIDGEKGAGVRK